MDTALIIAVISIWMAGVVGILFCMARVNSLNTYTDEDEAQAEYLRQWFAAREGGASDEV